jgi:hypothetical protein
MQRRLLSTLLCVIFLGLALAMPNAQAASILVFGQTGLADTVMATNNGMTGVNGGTMLSVVGAQISISAIDAPLPTPITAFLNLTATSDSNVTISGGHMLQDFNGSFTITANANGTGTNYLSGTFAGGAATGGSGATVFGSGTSLTLSASSPNGITSFSSAVIAALAPPRGMSLAFTNVTPEAFVTGNNTLGAFSSNISGNFSAIPEPNSMALLGIGLTGAFVLRRMLKRFRGA